MDRPNVASRAEWLVARKRLLAKEKDFTRQRDALSAERRQLPMVKVEKEYVFDGPDGRASLRDLFEGRRQLLVYHFMFDPSWDEGCPSCSFMADNYASHIVHLPARDTSFATISRAPLAKIARFKKRMGWMFRWLSSFGSDFNYDFHVSLDPAAGSVEYNYKDAAERVREGTIPTTKGELPGLSVYFRDGDSVFHTYSAYGRGLDPLLNTYNYLDLTPLGRQEDQEPRGRRGVAAGERSWIRYHDRYSD
jgi:predicted dithiol-disulfide oxidoreductase (DUF899 family)